jgi:hypothetical protein
MDDVPNPKVILPAILVSILLIAGVVGAFTWSKSRTSSIVLPGGVTYLGPTLSPTNKPTVIVSGKVVIPAGVDWTEYKGKQFPYTFLIPQSLSLGVFPNDPFDAVTVFSDGMDPQTNLFFRVEDLTKLKKTAYIDAPKLQYANDWWKDYTWEGVLSVTPFTNSTGLNGYRAKYKDASGGSPYDHVFFEVPGRKDLMIWLSGKLFDPKVFDRIVDSVAWL